MSNKICVALLGAGMLFTANVLSETFVLRNDLDEDIELSYYADTQGTEETEPVIVTLEQGRPLRLENDAQFWRMTFRYNGMTYSIVRSKEALKAGGYRNGRRVPLNGSLNGSKISNPDAIYEIVLAGERIVDLNVTDQSVLEEGMQSLYITLDR